MDRNSVGWALPTKNQRETSIPWWAVPTLQAFLSAIILASIAVCAEAAPSKGPGGVSRVFHVDCGIYAPGNPAWKAEHDDAILADGYGYSVVGNSYRGGSAHAYCWFFTQRGSITIQCPKRTRGTLFLHCIDLSNNQRRQTITVCGKYTDTIAGFLEPAGKWLEYALTEEDTATGRIDVAIVNGGGANAVISRIDFVPAGMKDALLPERDASPTTPEAMVEWDWRRQERTQRRRPGSRAAVADVLRRGEALLADLIPRVADDSARRNAIDKARGELAKCRRRFDELADNTPLREWEKLYLRSRWAVRNAAFSNPLLDFDELLFVKRHTPRIAHQCSHHVGSSQVPGSDLCVLSGLKPDGAVRSLLGKRLPEGAIGRPDLSADARRVVFPYAAPRPTPTAYPYGRPGEVGGACLDYQVYEIDVDGGGLRQLTTGPSENTEPCYLPDGRICFTSSRCGRLVQCGDWAIVFSLYTMNSDGSDVRSITEAKEGEWFPSVLDDGRIIYMRWEYVLKPFNTIQYLWTVHPDGTGARLAFGDHFSYSPGPLSFIEARQVPGTQKVIVTGAAHHNAGVGPICMVDLSRNRGDAAGLTRLTPEVGYPETSEMSGTVSSAGWYNAPYPLAEQHYLACYSYEPAHNASAGYGIYLMDVFGNRELIYRDAELSCYSPIPLRPRRTRPVLAPAIESRENSAVGTAMMLDVYRGLPGVKRGTVKHLRVLETICKEEHSIPQRLDVGIGSGWDPRRILGTVPVEPDGSARFEIPADMPIFFQALDEDYKLIRGMRSFMNVKPGESVTCVGCHEEYATAPPNRMAAALRKPAAKIAPPPWGAVPVSFPKVVQPVLDRHCTDCHDGTNGDEKSFDLRGDRLVTAKGADNQSPGPPWPNTPHRVSASFVNLLPHVDFTRLSGYGGEKTPLGSHVVGSHRSQLFKTLDAGHYGVKLNAEDRRRLAAWIDCNAPYLGDWDEYVLQAK